MTTEKKPARLMTVGVGVIIPRPSDMKILVGKRGLACKRGSGCWALPGGVTDSGENIVTALIREAYEETGLFVAPCIGLGEPPFITTVPFAVTDHLPQENHLSLWYITKIDIKHSFGAAYSGGKLSGQDIPAREPNKCSGWKWMSLQEIAKIPGVEDKKSEQYYWLPMDMWRMTLPKSLFGEF